MVATPQRPFIPTVARWSLLLLLTGFISLAATGPAVAQTTTAATSPTPNPLPTSFWQCTLPGGVYLVALRSIASISTHEYVVDGAARVTEVTVATNSMVEARFYYLEPMVANSSSPLMPTGALSVLTQRAQDLATTHSPVEDIWQKVVKTYPTTTHAHTVEYRLETKANLQALYASLQQSWTTGKGVAFATQ